ncbi:tyrosine-type recombinase/integrase [Enterococcus sp. 2201sp1_2201st1_B8_2201SCRN_220225]|uniref:tyrosine-type recombinase/integrase n=1 Tax=unclassified Enterococcus TaxID=2608891 RepID=UPI0034A2D01A
MWMKERKSKEGKTVYQYRERYKDPLTEKTRTVSVTLTSKSNQAKKQAAKLLQGLIDEQLNSSKLPNITFEKAMDNYLKKYKLKAKRSSYLSTISTVETVKRLVGPKTMIRNIDELFLQSLTEKVYYEEKYSFNYTRKIKALIIAVMKQAKKDNYQVTVPQFRMELILRQEASHEKYLEKNELRALIDQLNTRPVNARKADMVEFQALTGLRYGEMVALRNSEFHETYITVNGTIDHRDGKYSDEPVRTAPKTSKAFRNIPLSKRAVEIIRKVQQENQLMKREFPNYEDRNYIFTNKKGMPIDYRTFEPCLRNAAEKAGIDKPVSTHYLRHTHVSMLAEMGMPIKAIMDRVGHKDMKTTMEIYNHVTDKMQANLIEGLNKLNY